MNMFETRTTNARIRTAMPDNLTGRRVHTGRLRLVETIDRTKERLGLNDTLGRLDSKAEGQMRLIVRLFEGQLAVGEAQHFFGYNAQHRDLIDRINERFGKIHPEEEYGKAVLKLPLWKELEKTQGFWVLRLNPKIFDVPEKVRLEAGKDVRFADILRPKFRKLWHYVAANPFSNRGEIAGNFGDNIIHQFLSRCSSRHLHPMIDLEIPRPILSTSTEPTLYSANPEFAEKYKLKIPKTLRRKRNFVELFSREDRYLIEKLAAYEKATLEDIAGDRETENIRRQIIKINKRCKELGLPQAILKCGKRRTANTYKVNEKFCEELEIDCGSMLSIDAHFTNKQKTALEYIAENPLCTTYGLAKAVGTNMNNIRRILQEIDKVCDRNGWPKIVRVKTIGMSYYVKPTLADILELQCKPVNPEKLFTARRQIQIYGYFKQRIVGTDLEEASRRFEISIRNARRARNDVNRRLQLFDFAMV